MTVYTQQSRDSSNYDAWYSLANNNVTIRYMPTSSGSSSSFVTTTFMYNNAHSASITWYEGYGLSITAVPDSSQYIFKKADLIGGSSTTITNTSNQTGSYSLWSSNAGQWANGCPYTTILAYFDYAPAITITLDKQGGEGGDSSLSYYPGSYPSSYIQPPTRAGYSFQGYFSSKNGKGSRYILPSGQPSPSMQPYWPTSATTLYAYWLPTYSGGNGGQSTPYLISTKDDLQVLAEATNSGTNYSGTHFKQTRNIDISGSTWTPIGNSSKSFFGIYDGQNYKIEGLTINNSSEDQGLFGYVEGSSSSTKAEIKNVILENGYVSGGQYTGGIVGYAYYYVNIFNCKNHIDIKGTAHVGGIIGYAYSSDEVRNCLNTGSITATSSYVGGICGIAASGGASKITSCVNIGDISGGSSYVGGICGNGYGTFSSCISKGNITSTNSTGNYVGGLLGYAGSSSTILSNCSIEGYIFHSGSSTDVGAIIGYTYSSSNKIEACSFKGSSNKSLNLCGGTTAPTMTACWSKCGDSKVFSSTPDSTWTTYWAVVPNMNDGLPIQKTLYSVASVASSTLGELQTAFRNHGFSV